MNEAFIALVNTVNLDAAGKSRAGCRTDDGVHTGCVAAGGQNADSSEFFICSFYLSFYKLAF